MAAADPSLNRSIHQSTAAAAADLSPLSQSLNRSIHQSTAEAEAEAAELQPTELPRRPLLWALSDDDATLIAVDCLSDDVAPRLFTYSLPDRLHNPVLYDSVGPWLHLEEVEVIEEDEEDLEEEEDLPLVWSQPDTILFNPFTRTEFACIPYPASLMLPCVRIHTIVIDTDTNRSIALALVDNHKFRIVYTSFEDSDPCTSRPAWTDLTYLLSSHSISSNLVLCRDIYLQSALLHKDGLFYAVDSTGTKVFAFDFSTPATPTLHEVTFDLLNNYFTSVPVVDSCCYQSASLVGSGPSLFLVRWRNTLSKDGADARREIDVLRLDVGRKRWVPVKSLGHRSFFVGKHSSISLSVLDFPDLKSNRVYICLDAMMPISGNLFSCHYSVSDADCHSFRCHLLYNIEDESWGVFFDKSRIPEDCTSLLSASVWMLPPAKGETA